MQNFLSASSLIFLRDYISFVDDPFSQVLPKIAGGAANNTIVTEINTKKKNTTEIRYIVSRHGASLFLRLALMEPNNPQSAKSKNKIESM